MCQYVESGLTYFCDGMLSKALSTKLVLVCVTMQFVCSLQFISWNLIPHNVVL